MQGIYQAYWEKLKMDQVAHEFLMDDADYARAIVENFFWDYSMKYSDARPIMRTARDIDEKDLRLSHDIMLWAFAPLWFYRVEHRNEATARIINIGTKKVHTVYHFGRMPEAGSQILTRLLPFRGKEFCGHSVLIFPETVSIFQFESIFKTSCQAIGIKPSIVIRPDVHCDEWRNHGAYFLGQWRKLVYDEEIKYPLPDDKVEKLSFELENAEGLRKILQSTEDIRPKLDTKTGRKISDQWELKYRTITLADLQLKESRLKISPKNYEYDLRVRTWLEKNLAKYLKLKNQKNANANTNANTSANANWNKIDIAKSNSSAIEKEIIESTDSLPGRNLESQEEWIHKPLPALNGQSPIQASLHDWGRKRLQILLQELRLQGVDITSLKMQLGL